LAVAFAAPEPKPGVVVSSFGYSAPLAYSAYAAPSVVSGYGAVPLAYSAYAAPTVVV